MHTMNGQSMPVLTRDNIILSFNAKVSPWNEKKKNKEIEEEKKENEESLEF